MGWIRDSFLQVGNVLTRYLGLVAVNKTGGTLTRGTLVYISGWDTTTLRWKVTKADADSSSAKATWIVGEASVSDGSGLRLLKALELQGVDTSAGAVGDPVYESAVAGGWTLTNPRVADPTRRANIVGRVSVVHASFGKIQFDLLAHDSNVSGTVASSSFQTVPVRINATIAAESGNAIDVTLALADLEGNAVTRAQRIVCRVFDAAMLLGGTAGTAIGLSEVGAGSEVSTTAKNTLVIDTDANGAAVVRVGTASTGTVFLELVPEMTAPGSTHLPGFPRIVTLTFA